MKFNKKLFSLLFIALFAIVLVGCNGEDETTETPTDEVTTETPEDVDFTAALAHLQSEYADTLVSDTFEATEDLPLISSYSGFTFTWSSSNTDYLANDGTITRPLLTVGDQTVVLTVTVSKDDQSTTQDFFVTVKALEEKTVEEIRDEVFLFVFAIPDNEFWTSADDLNLTTTGKDDNGNEYPITWTSSHPDIIATDGEITQPEDADVDVTLTAKFTVDGTEFSQDRTFTVAKMAVGEEVDTIAAAIALGQDSYVEILGVTIIAMYEGGDVFFTDGVDVLYVYSPPFEAEIGDVYDITGYIDFYYNAPQLAGEGAKPLRISESTEAVSDIPTIDVAGVADVISAISVPSDENPHKYLQFNVTASVYYEESWGNYSLFLVPTDYDFDADLATGATQPNGDAIMIYYKSDMDVLKSFHGEEITIDIIMQGYRTDKSVFYGNFFGTAEDVQLSFSNDADAVEAALSVVEFPYSVVENKTFDLTTSIYGVTIDYTTDTSAVFNVATGAIDVSSLTGQATITVTATATKGTETDSKTISIKVGPLPTSDISDVLLLPRTDLAKIEGTVVAGGYHNLFFIQDGTDNIALYVYDDTMLTLLENNVGNVVSVTGEKDSYNGLHQLRASEVTFVQAGTPVTATNIDALTLDEAGLLDHQGELVELTGMVITDVYIDDNDNYEFTLERISDGEEIKLRWDSRYDLPTALDTEMKALEVGDKVSVTTVLSWFRGPQLALVTTTDFTVTTLTDADMVALDVRHMDTELTLSDDYVLEDGEFGSTISVVEIFGNAVNFMDTTTTAGTWAITQPYGTDVMAMVTFKVMSGTEEEMVEVEVTILGVSLASSTSDLIISEYGEGSGQNKWIEIYNGTGSDVDLTDYSIEYYNNGATAVTQTLDLTGTLADGEVLVLTTTDADAAIQAEADESFAYPAVVYFNGNDDVALVKDGTIIDLVGEIGSDADFAKDVTLVRNPSILTPNATFTIGEWTSHATDTFTFVGSHTVDTVTMTDEVTVNADLAAIDLGGIIKSAQTVTLPTTGEFGSTIVWTKTEDTDSNATMNGTNDEITFTDAPADTTHVVELQAVVTVGTESMTGTFVYKVEGVTDADGVAADKAEVEALNLGGDAYSEVSVSLPATGTNGSTITWAITTDEDSLASLTGSDLTIARAEGTSSVVVITATITKGGVSETLVITYNMMAEITDLSSLHSMTDDEYDIATGTEVYVVGVLTTDIFDGAFIQDANGKAILVEDLDGTVGDKILVTGTLAVVNGVRVLSNATQDSVIDSGNTLVYKTLTADEIIALDASDVGLLIEFDGLVIANDLAYDAEFSVVGTTSTITLYLDYYGSSSNNSNIHDVEGEFVDGDSLPKATFIFFDLKGDNMRIENLQIEITDQVKLDQDNSEIPNPVVLTEDMVIEDGTLGTTYVVTDASASLDGFVDYETTVGSLKVTRPEIGESDVTGTLTVTATNGSAVETITINITVLASSLNTTYVEDFANYSQGSYGDGSFVGTNGVTWTYENAMGGSSGYFQFKDSGFLSGTITGGISEMTFTAESFGADRSFDIIINGTTYTFSGIGTTAVDYTISDLDLTGDVTVLINNPSSSTKILSFEWIDYTVE